MKKMILLSEVAHLGQEIKFVSDQENAKQDGFKGALARTQSNIRPWDFTGVDVETKYNQDDKDDDDEDVEDDPPPPAKTDANNTNTNLPDILRERLKSVDSKIEASKDADATKLPRMSSNAGDQSIAAKSVHSTKSLSEQFKLGTLDKEKLLALIGEWEEPFIKPELLVRLVLCL